MQLDFLNPLYAHPGPFASVYLDTTRASEAAQDAIDLRWRALRGELERAGADGATLAAIERAAGSDKGVSGRHGQALFAAGGQVLLADELPRPPDRDFAQLAPLPHILPLLAGRGERIPHVLVVVDRLGADITAVGFDVIREKQVEGDATYPIRKAHAGDWSQTHFQRAVENTWEENAGQVAEEVQRSAASVAAQLVLLAGDIRARTLLRDSLSEPLRERVVELDAGSRAAGAAGEPLRAEVERAVQAKAAELVAEVVDDYRREHARGDYAVDGLEPVVAALRRCQVATLLVSADADLSMPGWFGPDPLALAVTEQELDALGVEKAAQDRTDAVLIRALARAKGDLAIVSDTVDLRDGVGAVLRFADASTER